MAPGDGAATRVSPVGDGRAPFRLSLLPFVPGRKERGERRKEKREEERKRRGEEQGEGNRRRGHRAGRGEEEALSLLTGVPSG